MAYVTGSTYGNNGGTATTIVCDLPASAQNDVTILSVSIYNNATISSIVGNNGGTWTLEASNLTNHYMWIYSCVQGATPDTSVTVTWTTTEYGNFSAINVKECDTTTPVETYAFSTTSERMPTCPSVTPSSTNSLIWCVVGNYFGEDGVYCTPGMVWTGWTNNSYFNSNCSAYTYHPTATATGTYEFAGTVTGLTAGTKATIAIKDAGSGVISGYHDQNVEAFAYLHMMNRGSGDLSDNTVYDPTTTNENISSLSNGSYTAPAVGYLNSTAQNGIEDGKFARRCGQIGGSNDYAILAGLPITETYGSVDNYDLSGSLISVCILADVTTIGKDSEIGSCLAISDKTNARFWQLGAKDSIPGAKQGVFPHVIECNSSAYEMDTVGTPNANNVGSLIIGGQPTSSYSYVYFSPVCKLGTMAIQGGSSTVPANFGNCYDIAKNQAMSSILGQNSLAEGQFVIAQDTQCGGSSAVYWDSTNQAAEWPAAYDADVKRKNYKISSGTLTHTIAAVTGSTVIYDSTTLNFGNYHNFVVNCPNVTISSDGLAVLNANVTLTAHNGAMSGVSFIGCKEITNSIDLSGGNTISNCVDTTAITVTSKAEFEDLHNCTFTGNNRAITITGNQTGIWSEPSLTVSGNTYDIEYTGTTDFTIQSAATLSVNNTSTGTLTIDTPTFDLTVNANVSGCQIHVYTTNTQTTLATEASASQLVYTHSSEIVDITVLKDGYTPYRQTALALSGTVTIDVQLVPSREYDSSHGLTYTTDASIYDNYNVITGITQANPAVVTYSGADNFSNGDIISIHDVIGMTEVNGKRYTVANVNTTANTFELSGINSTAYTVYSSAGIVLSGLSVPTFGPSGRGVFSLLMEQFRTNTSLRNLPFNLEMDGSNSLYLSNGVEGEADSDIENLTACGVQYKDVTATTTATWAGIEDKGDGPGANTGEYQQQAGIGTTDARSTGNFDEVIKIYGDTDHGNFDYTGHLVLKYQINGYREERVDVLDLYGITSLEPTLYVVSMNPVAISAATGDPGITITVTDHGVTPVTWNSKDFSISITYTGGETGEDILRELNYNLSLDATYQGKDPFNWSEMVIEAGNNYETLRGITEGGAGATLKGVRVVNGSGDPHPDFPRFQADDGTYYVVPVTSNISITGMPTAGNEIRLQIHNETAKTASAWAATTAYSLGDKVLRSTGVGTEQTAGLYMVCTTAGTSGGTEPTWTTTVGGTTADGTVTWTTYAILYYDADPVSASYADTYTDGEEFTAGDVYRIRFAELNTTTSFKIYETTGFVGSDGFTVAVSATEDDVYATNAIDGSSTAVTDKFSPDFSNNEIDLDTNSDFTATEAFAYYCYELTTSNGMYTVWGAVTAIDAANYRNNTSIFSMWFDETAGFVKQTDNARWFRDDGARPARDPTTGGSGIEINWRNPVYLEETGVSGLTPTESTQLAEISTVNTKIGTPGTTVSGDLTDIKGTGFSSSSDSLKAIRERGDQAWLTPPEKPSAPTV